MNELGFFSTETERVDDSTFLDILSGREAVKVETELKVTWETVLMFMVLIVGAGIASMIVKKFIAVK